MGVVAKLRKTDLGNLDPPFLVRSEIVPIRCWISSIGDVKHFISEGAQRTIKVGKAMARFLIHIRLHYKVIPFPLQPTQSIILIYRYKTCRT